MPSSQLQLNDTTVLSGGEPPADRAFVESLLESNGDISKEKWLRILNCNEVDF